MLGRWDFFFFWGIWDGSYIRVVHLSRYKDLAWAVHGIYKSWYYHYGQRGMGVEWRRCTLARPSLLLLGMTHRIQSNPPPLLTVNTYLFQVHAQAFYYTVLQLITFTYRKKNSLLLPLRLRTAYWLLVHCTPELTLQTACMYGHGIKTEYTFLALLSLIKKRTCKNLSAFGHHSGQGMTR